MERLGTGGLYLYQKENDDRKEGKTMTYKDNAVKDLRIAYIGGGSRGWAWTFMRDLGP